jgi:hypothetical protein
MGDPWEINRLGNIRKVLRVNMGPSSIRSLI